MPVEEKVVDLLLGGDPSDPTSAPSLKKQLPHLRRDEARGAARVRGRPEFTPIAGTKLMYAENTTGHLFVNADDQQAYILSRVAGSAGRRRSKGPWVFVPATSYLRTSRRSRTRARRRT